MDCIMRLASNLAKRSPLNCEDFSFAYKPETAPDEADALRLSLNMVFPVDFSVSVNVRVVVLVRNFELVP